MKKYISILSFVFLLVCLVSCEEDKKTLYPSAPKSEVIDITFYTATINGSLDGIIDDSKVQEIGVRLLKSNNTNRSNGTNYPFEYSKGDSALSLTLHGLSSETTYYYNIYLNYDGQQIESEIYSFKTKTPGDVISSETSRSDSVSVCLSIKSTSLLDYIDKVGICYSRQDNPSVSDNNIVSTEINGNNSYIFYIDSIIPGYKYYYKPFVVINDITFYGTTSSFEKKLPVGDAIDLGLSVNWASFNIGASCPEDTGYYYAWGEIETKERYAYYNYRLSNDPNTSNMHYTKYCSNSIYGYNGFTDGKYILEAKDDVATVKWGDAWRIPNRREWLELLNLCSWEKTYYHDVEGYLITSLIEGYTDKSIFLPIAGIQDEIPSQNTSRMGNGFYWSNTLVSDNGGFGDNTAYTWFDRVTLGALNRYVGLPVRPVSKSSNWKGLNDFSIKQDSVVIVDNTTFCKLELNDIKSGEADYKFTPIYWSSEDTSIAMVSGGRVVAKSPGKTLIKANCIWNTAEAVVEVIDDKVCEWVDLGLSVKWATCNIGALHPEDGGGYYAWGELEAKTGYGNGNYKWCVVDANTKLTKYVLQDYRKNGYNNYCDNYDCLRREDDLANIDWGEGCHIPTVEEILELVRNCNFEWVTQNNVEGLKITSNVSGFTDQSIFIPAAGYFTSDIEDGGNSVMFWSSNLHQTNMFGAQNFIHKKEDNGKTKNVYEYIKYSMRYHGLPIRPVKRKQ